MDGFGNATLSNGSHAQRDHEGCGADESHDRSGPLLSSCFCWSAVFFRSHVSFKVSRSAMVQQRTIARRYSVMKTKLAIVGVFLAFAVSSFAAPAPSGVFV